MASYWDKLKKMVMGGGPVKPVKKIRTDSNKALKKMREKESPSVKVIKQGKDRDKFTEKEIVRGESPTGAKTVETKYTPVVEKTKGGDYEKYGKDTKTAQSFRGAFAAARSAYDKGEGGNVFEWKGKKFSVARADDPKEAKPPGMSISDVQPPPGLSATERAGWFKEQNRKELEKAKREAKLKKLQSSIANAPRR